MKVVASLPDFAPVRPSGTVPIAEARDIMWPVPMLTSPLVSKALVIVDVERPEAPVLEQVYDADGQINDAPRG